MKVCFVENTSVINREHHLPLGSLTCEQLNSRGWDEYRLLGAQLDFLELRQRFRILLLQLTISRNPLIR